MPSIVVFGSVTPSGPFGRPPGYFNTPCKAIWAEIARHALPGVLANSDEGIVEMLVLLIDSVRIQSQGVPPKAASRATLRTITAIFRQLLMTPDARDRVLETAMSLTLSFPQ